MDSGFQIFISYARPDREIAEEIYTFLKEHGFEPWVDFKKLKGGQNWDFEIKRELDRSALVVILWSKNSRDRRGYVQREIKIALDKLQEKLIDDIYIIPVVADEEIAIPEQFKNIQCLSVVEGSFKSNLLDAVSHQIERLGGERKRLQREIDLYWRSSTLKEEWEGLPGYQFDIQLLEFESDKYRSVRQITAYIRGHFLGELFDMRRHKLNQSIDIYNYAQEKWRRTNTFDAECGDPIVCGNVVSLNYMVNRYGAGAAHPVHHHRTFAFLLDPLVRIEKLRDIFAQPDDAFAVVQNSIRAQLLEYKPWDGEETGLEESWVTAGTENWSDFDAFVFSDTGVNVYFSSYQVAPYAVGTPHVSLSYRGIIKLMREEFVTALNISRYKWEWKKL